MPRAFITGITGQDGHHLAEFLHGKGYDVYGMIKGQNNPRAAKLHSAIVPSDLLGQVEGCLPASLSTLCHAL